MNKEGLKNLILYGIFGVMAAVIEYGIFSLLLACTPLHVTIINVIGQVCGFTFSFTTNTFLNFKKADKLFRRFVSYGAICLIGMSFTTFVLGLLESVIEPHLLKLCCMIFVALVQFVLNKLITYKN